MSKNNCSTKQFYTDLLSADFSISYIDATASFSFNFSSDKPFIPVGIYDSATNLFSFAKSQTYSDLYEKFMQGCLDASYNYTDENGLEPSYIVTNPIPDYGNYLARKQSVKSLGWKLVRYLNVAKQVKQFWDSNLASIADLVYMQKAFQDFIPFIIANSDKNMWIAPGGYHTSGDALDTYLNSIITAEGWTYVRIAVLQLNSIG